MNPTTINCDTACTITLAIEWPQLTDAQIADYMELWGLFLAVSVSVLVVKAIYNRFRIDHNEKA